MAVTPTDIVNQAIQLIGNNQPAVTGTYPTFDSSPAGVAAANLYGPCIQTVARRFGWDFGRTNAALVLTGNSAPTPYSYEYTYPADGLEIRQLIPAAPDANNPSPVSWTVGNSLVSAVPTKVIWTNVQNAQVVYTNNPPPTLWDAGFREAAVRLLASELAMAIPSKPQTSDNMLQSSERFESVMETRNG